MAFCCSAGPLAVRQVMEEEMTTRVGPKGRHDADRVATRNGAAARSAPTRRCPQAALLARALQYTKTGIPDRSTSPLSSCSPRSSNSMPDPATRSTTVRDTKTSLSSAPA
jgi:hypothetical protein